MAAMVLDQVGQIVPPWIVQSWIHMVRGDVIPSLRGEGFDEALYRDPIYAAMRRACANHYDPLISACASVEDQTVAQLVEDGHPLIDNILHLTIGEIAGGLSALQTVEPAPSRSRPTSRKNRRARPRPAGAPEEDDSPQLELGTSTPAQKAREDLDRRILSELSKHPDTGLLAAELRKRVSCSSSQFRYSIKRLTSAQHIHKTGVSSNTRYFPTE